MAIEFTFTCRKRLDDDFNGARLVYDSYIFDVVETVQLQQWCKNWVCARKIEQAHGFQLIA